MSKLDQLYRELDDANSSINTLELRIALMEAHDNLEGYNMAKLDELREQLEILETEVRILQTHIALLESQEFEDYKAQVNYDYNNLTRN